MTPAISRGVTPAIHASGSHAPAADAGTISDKAAIIIALGQSPELADRGDRTKGNLHLAYKRYKAILGAQKAYNDMQGKNLWVGNKLTQIEIIELFISRSYYFSHYRQNFKHVDRSPLLIQWLEKENITDEPDDMAVWGEEKVSYGFSDLEKYLGALGKKEKSRKGKGKEVKEKKDRSKKKKVSGSSKK